MKCHLIDIISIYNPKNLRFNVCNKGMKSQNPCPINNIERKLKKILYSIKIINLLICSYSNLNTILFKLFYLVIVYYLTLPFHILP